MCPAELPPHVRPAPQEHRTIGRLVTQGLLEPDPHFGRAGLGGTVLELGRRLIHVYRDDQGAHLDPASSLPGRSSGRLVSGKMDAPRLVSSAASPPRPECAVTRLSTPATMAAAVNRNPIICADSGTTRSPGSGLVAARPSRPRLGNRAGSTPRPSWGRERPFLRQSGIVSGHARHASRRIAAAAGSATATATATGGSASAEPR